MRSFALVCGGVWGDNSKIYILNEAEVRDWVLEDYTEDELSKYPLKPMSGISDIEILSRDQKVEDLLDYIIFNFDGGYAGDWRELKNV